MIVTTENAATYHKTQSQQDDLDMFLLRNCCVREAAEALTNKGYKLLEAQVEMLPQNGYIKLTNEDDIKNMQKMLDMFEDNEDVQNVWHNWEDAE